jgi:hypothetical protein
MLLLFLIGERDICCLLKFGFTIDGDLERPTYRRIDIGNGDVGKDLIDLSRLAGKQRYLLRAEG